MVNGGWYKKERATMNTKELELMLNALLKICMFLERLKKLGIIKSYPHSIQVAHSELVNMVIQSNLVVTWDSDSKAWSVTEKQQ